MKLTIRLFFLLTVSLCFYNCSNNGTKSKEFIKNRQPDFVDNGKTVDSLIKVYNCESIEYNNWEDNDATDSCLTVCLINSNKVPSGDNVNGNVNQLKGIALSIKNSLAKPENYNSLYIIFVKKDNVNGLETKNHSAGMKIPTTEL